MSDALVTGLAELLHTQLCEDGSAGLCRRWNSGPGPTARHRAWYTERAKAILKQLEPEIGAANVMLAVRVITREVI